MQFTTRKHRQPPAVIIISLIDILIVLLIFLMVTTTFRQVPALKINLPQSATTPKAGSSQTPPMVVTIKRDPPHLYLNKLPVVLTRLQEEFMAAARRDSNATVAINADTNAPMQEFVDVLAAATAAKIKAGLVYTHPKGR